MSWLYRISQSIPPILGFNSGNWYEGSPIGNEWDWYITPEGDVLHINNATEYHEGFRTALAQIASKYPIEHMTLSFDGNTQLVSEFLSTEIDWSNIVFYHGTSSNRWEKTQQRGGLFPRKDTGESPGYGADKEHVVPSRSDLIYLTTQLGMARFAARDAAQADGSSPIILRVIGLDERYMVPDEDSRQISARKSLAIMGSVGYSIPIPLSQITIESQLAG
jgi:hypothetical protein